MSEEEHYLVCIRAQPSTEPEVASKKVPCSKCNAVLWRADSSPREPLAICISCFVDAVRRDPDNLQIVGPNKEQMNEIAQWLKKEKGQ